MPIYEQYFYYYMYILIFILSWVFSFYKNEHKHIPITTQQASYSLLLTHYCRSLHCQYLCTFLSLSILPYIYQLYDIYIYIYIYIYICQSTPINLCIHHYYYDKSFLCKHRSPIYLCFACNKQPYKCVYFTLLVIGSCKSAICVPSSVVQHYECRA